MCTFGLASFRSQPDRTISGQTKAIVTKIEFVTEFIRQLQI